MGDRVRAAPARDLRSDLTWLAAVPSALSLECLAAWRLRAEVNLLAAVAGCPRVAWPIAAGAGVTAEHMANPDAAAILLSLVSAAGPAGPPAPREATALHAAELLRAVGRWNPADDRPFVTLGEPWGPGPLAALFTCVPFGPETVLAAARRLLDVDGRQCAAIAAARRCRGEDDRRCP